MKQKITRRTGLKTTASIAVLVGLIFVGGCRQAESVVADTLIKEPKLSAKEAFLGKFDQLFNEDIAEQNEEYKENIRRFILIHALDLLRQIGEDENAFDKITVHRTSLPEKKYRHFDAKRRSLDLKEEIFLSRQEIRYFSCYCWSIGIKQSGTPIYDPYYTLLGVWDNEVVMCRIIFQYGSCAGLFNDCCGNWHPPKYITNIDGNILEEVIKCLDAVSTLKLVEVNLGANLKNDADRLFRGFHPFYIEPGENFSEVSSDYLRKVRNILLNN